MRLEALCRAYVSAEHAQVWKTLAPRIRKMVERCTADELDWRLSPSRATYEIWLRKHPQLTRSVVPKAPGPNGEKGVILSYFEYNWLRLMENGAAFRELCRDFNLVLSTSWSPTDYHLLAQAAALAPDSTIFVQACNYDEIAKIECFHPRLRCLATLPCDWLHPGFFAPLPDAERDIDLLVVSNWAPFKRHWALFNALRELPASLRVVCIGQPDDGHTLDDIRQLQRRLGAPQQIEFLQSIPIENVTALQCRARVAVIASLWEGCCVAAAEALMAGAALAMCRDAHVGPRVYIDGDTGSALSRQPLAREIAAALERSSRQQPRAFAERRLSHIESGRKLNELLRAHETAAGRPWTQDLAPICWRPYPKIVGKPDEERLAPCYAELHRRFPGIFPADLLQNSGR
jgi:glycosyltransferase involved in cell wall biosynthesis